MSPITGMNRGTSRDRYSRVPSEPRWQAAGPLLDREIRRVGTAAVRGGMAALLNNLHPGLSYHDGTFAFASACDPSYTLGPLGSVGPRRLALVPMIAGRSALFSFERPDVCYIGYPLPQPGPGAPATADSALATILGPVRASILQALRQPLTGLWAVNSDCQGSLT